MDPPSPRPQSVNQGAVQQDGVQLVEVPAHLFQDWLFTLSEQAIPFLSSVEPSLSLN